MRRSERTRQTRITCTQHTCTTFASMRRRRATSIESVKGMGVDTSHLPRTTIKLWLCSDRDTERNVPSCFTHKKNLKKHTQIKYEKNYRKLLPTSGVKAPNSLRAEVGMRGLTVTSRPLRRYTTTKIASVPQVQRGAFPPWHRGGTIMRDANSALHDKHRP